MATRLIGLILLLIPSLGLAARPLFPHKETEIHHEFERVYKEIDRVRSKTGHSVRVHNLQISRVNNTQNHVLYDWIALEDDNGNIVTSGSRTHNILTGDITASDPGGLDTGTEQSDTWYALHVISNGEDFHVRYSTTSNKPVMPEGYQFWGHVGWMRNDSSGHIEEYLQDGNYVQWKDRIAVVNAQTTGIASNTTTDVSSCIPPLNTAWAGYFMVTLASTYTDSADKELTFQLSGPLLGSYSSGAVTPVILDRFYQESSTIQRAESVWTITNEDGPQIIWYADSTSLNRSGYTIDIDCRGYLLNIFD